MKTKIFVILLSVVAIVSFTALTNGKENTDNKAAAASYQSSGGQTMSDPNQFD